MAVCAPSAPGELANADAVMAHAARHRTSYRFPRVFHFLGDLLRTANGKALRRVLRR